jgi:hypothetical protein
MENLLSDSSKSFVITLKGTVRSDSNGMKRYYWMDPMVSSSSSIILRSRYIFYLAFKNLFNGSFLNITGWREKAEHYISRT